MTATKGVVDARIHVLHSLEVNGQLDPAIALILDLNEPGWREDREERRWFEAAAAAREWTARTGLSPETRDDGGAGLRPWLDSQDLARLNTAQRHELESLPGWRSTIDDPAADEWWRTVVALVEQGTRPSRGHETEASRWLAGEYRRTHPDAVIAPASVTGRAASSYLDYALFRARNLREPGRGDSGARWSAQNQQAAAAGPRGPNSLWVRSAARAGDWTTKNGRNPRLSGPTREERYCAGWLKRQRARAAHGLLSPDAAARLASIDVDA